ncbi:tRNA (adenosine(37)-N6)-threonylcarbamoyltransferase complex ATPase subunit type 1 TsaE [Frigidibacter sp. MR17.24]|uniref:tRNA (adenosine(37)-N6)-threonylcarbamoyltransferase complex ATPase subunit type 1 TsaE n=1 Tax=Frigidibacter sp. MR17.24 TaxID=3127345 RepID=UPI003012FAD7
MTDTASSTLLHLADPAATEALARRLAPALAAGDVLLLAGEIGAGKTHFARALIQARLAAAGTVEDVPSPTFTLVQTYAPPGQPEIWHADLYRLTDPDEAAELGLEDAFSEAVCLVEWPERLGWMTPADRLELTLVPEGEGRALAVTATGPRAARLLPLIGAPRR